MRRDSSSATRGSNSTVVTARSDAGRVLSDLYPRYRVDRKLETFDADRVAEGCDAALVAYPHGAAAPTVEDLRTRGLKVVDLSADFRVPQELYERWYGPHPAPKLLDEAVYGLTEMNRDADPRRRAGGRAGLLSDGRAARAAAAEGPRRRHVRRREVGRVGRGREATETTHFVSVAENLTPYKVEGHRHQAELDAYFGPATFVPHLLPIDQGLTGQLLRAAEPRGDGATRCARCSRTPTATTRSSRSWTRRRACATCATRTSAGSTRPP